MKLLKIKFKTKKGIQEAYFIKVTSNKYINIALGEGFNEIEEEDILDLEELSFSILGEREFTKVNIENV